MFEAAWTFRKGPDALTLRRSLNEAQEPVLIVDRADEVRTWAFASCEELARFQGRMEAFLVRTGWTLGSFSPERRSPRDRRSFPRVTNDRRRWWTDSSWETPRYTGRSDRRHKTASAS